MKHSMETPERNAHTMDQTQVVLIAGGRQHVLGQGLQVVPASEVVLVIKGAERQPVRLDGVTRRLRSTGGVLPLDLRRSTGYHRLSVGSVDFWFATNDAKATLAGIEEMLAELRGIGTGWTGQLAFSDGSGLRDPHVVYGWLDSWANHALAAARAILHRPHTDQVIARALSRRGGAGVDVPATMRLLRSDPNRFLERHETGIITIRETRYMPQRVITRRRRSTVDIPANRRVVWLVARVRALAKEVYESTDVRMQQVQCMKWINASDSLLATGVAQRLARFAHLSAASPRSPIELTDQRYSSTYSLSEEVSENFGWTPSPGFQSRYSYIQKSDQIYQAYCATVIANDLRMIQTDPVLGRRQPAFVGPDLALYFDTTPPSEVIQSWRSLSEIPDRSRPDILVHKPSTHEVAIIDAKYRVDEDRASEDSRKEVSAYMALYGVNRIGIAFPATAPIRNLSGWEKSIVEIPIRPPTPQVGDLTSWIHHLFQAPPYL